jgi:hypothetical protein
MERDQGLAALMSGLEDQQFSPLRALRSLTRLHCFVKPPFPGRATLYCISVYYNHTLEGVMSLARSMKSVAAVGLAAVFLAPPAFAYPQRMGYDLDAASVASLASYIGFSEFCVQDNLDFRGVGHQLAQKMSHQPYWTQAGPERKQYLNTVFLESQKWGAQGYLYVPSEDAFLNTPKPGMTMEFVCKRGYQEAVKLFQMLR